MIGIVVYCFELDNYAIYCVCRLTVKNHCFYEATSLEKGNVVLEDEKRRRLDFAGRETDLKRRSYDPLKIEAAGWN